MHKQFLLCLHSRIWKLPLIGVCPIKVTKEAMENPEVKACLIVDSETSG
ncbi:MAG: hypothetical protein U0M15_02820 [Bacillota bacterium]|nr:hypothetical protein [Bacillota bacterium]